MIDELYFASNELFNKALLKPKKEEVDTFLSICGGFDIPLFLLAIYRPKHVLFIDINKEQIQLCKEKKKLLEEDLLGYDYYNIFLFSKNKRKVLDKIKRNLGNESLLEKKIDELIEYKDYLKFLGLDTSYYLIYEEKINSKRIYDIILDYFNINKNSIEFLNQDFVEFIKSEEIKRYDVIYVSNLLDYIDDDKQFIELYYHLKKFLKEDQIIYDSSFVLSDFR